MEDLVISFLCCCECLFTQLVSDIECVQVIVGTVAIRGLHLNLSPPAFEQFQNACIVFESAAETSSRAARALVRHPRGTILLLLPN